MTAPGIIEQLYYPYMTINEMNCWWYIKAPDGHVIRFTFLEFQLPYYKGCNYEYLKIYDGDQASGSSLGKLCGYIYPQFVQSSSSTMTIQFHVPRQSHPTRGFRGRYEFIEGMEYFKFLGRCNSTRQT